MEAVIDHKPTDEEKLARAIEHGGYKEPEPLSREDRANALVAELEHAVKHNAPVTLSMIAEIRDLLDVPKPDDTPAADLGDD